MKLEEQELPEAEGLGKKALEKTKKVKLVLKIEPGDGLATISWQIPGLGQSSGNIPFKYSLFLGNGVGSTGQKNRGRHR